MQTVVSKTLIGAFASSLDAQTQLKHSAKKISKEIVQTFGKTSIEVPSHRAISLKPNAC